MSVNISSQFVLWNGILENAELFQRQLNFSEIQVQLDFLHAAIIMYSVS